MKFGEKLLGTLTPEWKDQYVDYESLKILLYEGQDQSPDADTTEEAAVHRYYARFEERFFAICDKELTKVNTFYAEKVAESVRRFTTLESELRAQKESTLKKMGNLRRKSKIEIFNRGKRKIQVKTIRDLKLAFSEFYLNLVLLQDYQQTNFTAFRKILKKHDKVMETEKGCKWRQEYVETAPFHTDTRIIQMIQKTETSYINDLENGDRSKAMKRLRVPPLSERESMYPKGTVFLFGLFLGIFIVTLIAGILSAIILDIQIDPWLVLDLYRPGLVLFLFLFFIGINVWGWRSSGVNHVLIFEINPREHLSHYHLFELAAVFAVLWSISCILLIYGNLETVPENVPVYLSPGLLYAIYLVFLLNPIPAFHLKARVWLLRRLGRIMTCGLYPGNVEFADFWLADQLNSLASLFVDFEFVICFYGFDGNIFSGWTDQSVRRCGSYSYGLRAVLSCFPALMRFGQCIRRYWKTKKLTHLINAGKYSTVFFKVTFNALFVLHFDKTNQLVSVYFILWLASLLISSCYTLAWDIKMDWGFLDSNAGENKWLREEIVYSHKAYYYFAMVENSILRFSWVIHIAVRQTTAIPNSVLSTIFIILEVFRRFVWNFFRLENEHLNNCGEFRAVRDISVTPLHEDDLTTLERMMDEEDGVEKYRKREKDGSSGGKSLVASIAKKAGLSLRRNASSGVMLYVGSGSDEEGTSTSAM